MGIWLEQKPIIFLSAMSQIHQVSQELIEKLPLTSMGPDFAPK